MGELIDFATEKDRRDEARYEKLSFDEKLAHIADKLEQLKSDYTPPANSEDAEIVDIVTRKEIK